MSADTKKALVIAATSLGITASEFVRTLLERKLERGGARLATQIRQREDRELDTVIRGLFLIVLKADALLCRAQHGGPVELRINAAACADLWKLRTELSDLLIAANQLAQSYRMARPFMVTSHKKDAA